MRSGLLRVVCLTLALAGCAETPVKAPPAPTPAPVATEPPEALFAKAAELVYQRKIPEARERLLQLAAGMPPGWQPVRESPNNVTIAYWDQQEFLECSQQDSQRYKKSIEWTAFSYTRVWYLLAFIAIEDKQGAEAERAIDQALALEPDRALLLNEKATILQQSQAKLAEGLAYNHKAIDSQRCTSAAARKANLSRAWRSLGVTLIDLGKFDEADTALGESLKVDPGNRMTMNELVYLEKMRGNKPQRTPIEIKRVQ
jgi:Flp pilus assembly protein TadD